MIRFRPLPWEYGVRNLLRRPGRSALTLAGLTLVVLLVFVVVAFIRGLETSLAVSGDERVVLVHTPDASENIENSSIEGNIPDVLTASLSVIQRRAGPGEADVVYASPELYLGTNVTANGSESMGLVRGVTPAALMVRSKVQLVEGKWPGPGEVMVGRLAAAKLGLGGDTLSVGRELTYEGRNWHISGRFAALGSALEAEVWCPLDDLQRAMKRQDLCLVAVTLAPGEPFAEVDKFCRRWRDLKLQATRETEYYESLHRHYRPVRALAWLVASLVAGAGIFAGLNTMYGAVAGRVRELATLQALGFSRRAIALSLVQEATVLAAAGSLSAAALALLLVNGSAVRFTMGAFALRVDAVTIAVGCGVGLMIGVLGALPPALRAMRLPVVEGLKAV